MYMSSKFNQLVHERESFVEQFSSRNRNACHQPGSTRTQKEKGEVVQIERKEEKKVQMSNTGHRNSKPIHILCEKSKFQTRV